MSTLLDFDSLRKFYTNSSFWNADLKSTNFSMIKEIANSVLKSNSKRFVESYLLNVPKTEPQKLHAPEKLLIRDPSGLKQKLKNLQKSGLQDVQIVADFDGTWTYANINGNECESTLGAIKMSALLPQRLKEIFTEQDKEFVSTVEGEILAASLIVPRWNADRFIKYCFEQSVRLKFCSVGLTNMILPILKHWVDIENYQQFSIVANTVFFSPQETIIGYRKPVIHRYSKSSSLSREKDLKNNLIILGDRLSDAHIDRDMPRRNTLKIGFCNDRDLLRLKEYCNLFDIVLLNGSFSLNVVVLKYINGELTDSDLEDILSENTFDQLYLKPTPATR